MKLSEYSLKKDVSIFTGPLSDPIQFPAGTLIQPFWSEGNLPNHIIEQLNEHRKIMHSKSVYIMCMIGMFWVPVLKEDIRSSN